MFPGCSAKGGCLPLHKGNTWNPDWPSAWALTPYLTLCDIISCSPLLRAKEPKGKKWFILLVFPVIQGSAFFSSTYNCHRHHQPIPHTPTNPHMRAHTSIAGALKSTTLPITDIFLLAGTIARLVTTAKIHKHKNAVSLTWCPCGVSRSICGWE